MTWYGVGDETLVCMVGVALLCFINQQWFCDQIYNCNL